MTQSTPSSLLLRPVIVVPTYNNASTLHDILQRIAALGLPMIVVNDGSTDRTGQVLHDWLAEVKQRDLAALVLTHERNRGKAAALLTGFAAAIEQGYTHAITIDTDGQLDPEEIPLLLSAAQESPCALVLGTRDDTKHDYPARSRLGRRLSNAAIRWESGVRISDSQCGLRVYPLGLIQSVPCRASRFAFEAEIITRAGWAGCPVIEVPVTCRYFPPGKRVSHFRPILDSVRGIALHARLLLRALIPWPHPRWPGEAALTDQQDRAGVTTTKSSVSS